MLNCLSHPGTPNEVDFKTKTVIRDKEWYYIIIKGIIQQKDITIVNMYAPKYIKQLITKKLIDNNTIIIGNFHTTLTSMDRSSKQKINRETMTLNDTLEEMDLIDIFRTFHAKREYTFFSSAHSPE